MVTMRAVFRGTFVAAIFVLASDLVFAQAKPATAIADAAKPSSIGIDQQWEYIVVSYGKTLFGSPQKTLAYRSIGLTSGQEAPDLENSLDILGRFGWEVVTIVGSIGGDQQIVLKRKYNRTLASNEYKAILKGKDLYIKDLIDIMEREQRLRDEEARNAEAEKSKPRLVELDAEEARVKRVERESALVQVYRESFPSSELAKFSTATVTYRGGGVKVDIVSDVTGQFLVDGNTYRKSDLDKFMKAKLTSYRFRHPSLNKDDGLDIKITAIIQFNGERTTVGTYHALWSTYSSAWY